MQFVDALALFVSVYTKERAKTDKMTMEEVLGGLISVIAYAVEQCEPHQRGVVLEAVHKALDDRMEVGQDKVLN